MFSRLKNVVWAAVFAIFFSGIGVVVAVADSNEQLGTFAVSCSLLGLTLAVLARSA